MYKLLPQLKNQIFDDDDIDDDYESTSRSAGPSAEFLCEAVFAGGAYSYSSDSLFKQPSLSLPFVSFMSIT